MTRRFFRWVFKEEVAEFQSRNKRLKEAEGKYKSIQHVFERVLEGVEVSVDVNESPYDRSWAVISLQGEKADYVRFLDLGDAEIRHIQSFLKRFEKVNVKIDANPYTSTFLRIPRY